MPKEARNSLRSPLLILREELNAYFAQTFARTSPAIALEHINEILARTEDALASRDSLLTTIFQNSPYISVVVDAEGRIRDINRAGISFAGREKKALLNLLGGEVFGCLTAAEGAGCGANEQCTHCPIRTRVTHTFSTREEIFAAEGEMSFLRDGIELDRSLLVSTSLIRVSDEDMVLVTLVDITDQKVIEQRLADTNLQLQERIRQNEVLQLKLRQEAIRDPLTGLYNRRYLHETFPRELARSKRQRSRLSLIMLDVDHFKQLNDTQGHLAGDAVLAGLGSTIIENSRLGDLPCRFGGEEFLLLLPDTPLEAATAKAEEIRRHVEAQVFASGDQTPGITVSAGVASAPAHGDSPEELVKSADSALYAAKAAGRNCVAVCTLTETGSGEL
jgi:diguanylate cyclase (GGDEF)-like protein